MVTTRSEAWKRVTRHDPCPICEKDHWCKVSPDGAVVCCMFNFDQAYRIGQLQSGEPYALHRLRDDRPYEPQAPTFTIPTPEDDAGFDVLTARAVYAVTAAHCATEVPDFVHAELVRRFGAVYGPLAIERFGLGYCNSPQLVKALDAAGRRPDAIAAGVLHPKRGQAVSSLAGRITIPYRRGGGVLDLRGAGIKGQGETKEMSLPGGYVERDVVGLFFNHDDLETLPAGEAMHMAGGAYKTMALAMSGLLAIGTRGEGELSDAQLAALHTAGVTDVVLHIDAEDAKEGERLSSGRRLGLSKAERLAGAGLIVSIAEPAREPGTAKVDPDALLRDFGPDLVRAYARSALPVAAWRVAIGVAPADVSVEAAAKIATLEKRCAKLQRTLSNVLQIRRNGAIKAERDTLTASVLHMAAAQEGGRTTPAGRIRQPLYVIAESVGKGKPAVSKHLKLAQDEDLFERELLEEVLVREVDEATGQTHHTLRLKNASGRVVEECPAEPVLGAALAYRHATGEEATGAYYVTPKHEPTAILDILVTLKPNRGEKKWGGKRECASCGSTNTRREVRIVCDDCGHRSEPIAEPQPIIPPAGCTAEQPDAPVTDVFARTDEPVSIPPTSVEEIAADPLAAVRNDRHDEPADDWDPFECNHQGCTARIDPALGKRYCWQHRPSVPHSTATATTTASPAAPVGAAFTLGGVRVGPPKRDVPAQPPPMPVAPVAIGPLPRCLACGCANRVERRGDRFCHPCANSGEGYENEAVVRHAGD